MPDLFFSLVFVLFYFIFIFGGGALCVCVHARRWMVERGWLVDRNKSRGEKENFSSLRFKHKIYCFKKHQVARLSLHFSSI